MLDLVEYNTRIIHEIIVCNFSASLVQFEILKV